VNIVPAEVVTVLVANIPILIIYVILSFMTIPSKISCIICAYNEEPRIDTVLKAVSGHPAITEIIVVNDGSTDGTAQKATSYEGVRVISHPRNIGKTAAIITGIEAAQYELLMFLDADLINIDSNDITLLARPVLDGKSDISISLKQNSLSIMKFVGLDFCSGERVFSKTLFANKLQEMRTLSRFGAEVFLNRIVIKDHLRISVVRWNKVSHARKSEKIGIMKGTLGEIKMILDMLKVISFVEIVSQNYKMLRARV